MGPLAKDYYPRSGSESSSSSCGAGLFPVFFLGLPDPIEGHEVSLHTEVRKLVAHQLRCLPQFSLVMSGFGLAVALEARQPAISRAVGVAREDHTAARVKSDGQPDLLQNEV